MRSFKTEGIIIKRRNYRDADRILTVFSKEHGKMQVKAVGVRKITSRRSPHVELLNHCILSLYNGSKFPILTEAQAIDNFSDIKQNLQKVGLAYHLCELIDGLCAENQEHASVFHLFKNTLNRLSQIVILSEAKNPMKFVKRSFVDTQDDIYSIIHEFEIELLTLLGYLPRRQAGDRQGWNRANYVTVQFDTQQFIENILERRLKSRYIFAKLE